VNKPSTAVCGQPGDAWRRPYDVSAGNCVDVVFLPAHKGARRRRPRLPTHAARLVHALTS